MSEHSKIEWYPALKRIRSRLWDIQAKLDTSDPDQADVWCDAGHALDDTQRLIRAWKRGTGRPDNLLEEEAMTAEEMLEEMAMAAEPNVTQGQRDHAVKPSLRAALRVLVKETGLREANDSGSVLETMLALTEVGDLLLDMTKEADDE